MSAVNNANNAVALYVNEQQVGEAHLNNLHNEAGRMLNGIPGRPAGTTKEMERLASKVVNIQIKQGDIRGWFGDTSQEYIQDSINKRLEFFRDFRETGERIHPNYVESACSQVIKHKQMSKGEVNKYAHFLGYKLQWKKSRIFGIYTYDHLTRKTGGCVWKGYDYNWANRSKNIISIRGNGAYNLRSRPQGL